jgi:hypothetical protein
VILLLPMRLPARSIHYGSPVTVKRSFDRDSELSAAEFCVSLEFPAKLILLFHAPRQTIRLFRRMQISHARPFSSFDKPFLSRQSTS